VKLDGYIRVSKVNGRKGDSFISPEVQRESIERWADAHKHEIVEWHQELDKSAGAGKKRPVFEALMARVIAGESKGIVVWKLSRFGRSQIEAAIGIRKVEDAGGVVRSATEGGSESKLVRNILLTIAEDELDRITESWRASREHAIDRGLWLAVDPFGYRKTVKGADKNSDPEYGPLEVDDAEGPIVTETFKLAAGQGLEAARQHLERETGKPWRADRTRRLLRSRVYLGEVRHGDDLVKTDAHEPLTTPATFAAVQRQDLDARPRRTKVEYPLSLIAVCGLCESGMVGNRQRVRGHEYRRMRCSSCGGCSIDAPSLEAYVRDRIAIVVPARRVDYDPSDELVQAQEALEQAQSDRSRWASDDRARTLMGDPEWYEGLEARTVLLKEAEDRYAEVAGQAARSEWRFSYDELEDPEQFVRAVGATIKVITVNPGRGPVRDRVEIEWQDVCRHVAASPFVENAGPKTVEAGTAALAARPTLA
jgi:site-specific DNA recombinase